MRSKQTDDGRTFGSLALRLKAGVGLSQVLHRTKQISGAVSENLGLEGRAPEGLGGSTAAGWSQWTAFQTRGLTR